MPAKVAQARVVRPEEAAPRQFADSAKRQPASKRVIHFRYSAGNQLRYGGRSYRQSCGNPLGQRRFDLFPKLRGSAHFRFFFAYKQGKKFGRTCQQHRETPDCIVNESDETESVLAVYCGVVLQLIRVGGGR